MYMESVEISGQLNWALSSDPLVKQDCVGSIPKVLYNTFAFMPTIYRKQTLTQIDYAFMFYSTFGYPYYFGLAIL